MYVALTNIPEGETPLKREYATRPGRLVSRPTSFPLEAGRARGAVFLIDGDVDRAGRYKFEPDLLSRV